MKRWFSCCLRIQGNSSAVLFPYMLTKFQAQLKSTETCGNNEWKDNYGKSPLGIKIPIQLYTGSCYHRNWAPEHLSSVLGLSCQLPLSMQNWVLDPRLPALQRFTLIPSPSGSHLLPSRASVLSRSCWLIVFRVTL